MTQVHDTARVSVGDIDVAACSRRPCVRRRSPSDRRSGHGRCPARRSRRRGARHSWSARTRPRDCRRCRRRRGRRRRGRTACRRRRTPRRAARVGRRSRSSAPGPCRRTRSERRAPGRGRCRRRRRTRGRSRPPPVPRGFLSAPNGRPWPSIRAEAAADLAEHQTVPARIGDDLEGPRLDVGEHVVDVDVLDASPSRRDSRTGRDPAAHAPRPGSGRRGRARVRSRDRSNVPAPSGEPRPGPGSVSAGWVVAQDAPLARCRDPQNRKPIPVSRMFAE